MRGQELGVNISVELGSWVHCFSDYLTTLPKPHTLYKIKCQCDWERWIVKDTEGSDCVFFSKCCRVQTRYWITTAKQITKEHLLLGNKYFISKCKQPLLSNIFVNIFPRKRLENNNEKCFPCAPYRDVIRRTAALGNTVPEGKTRPACSWGI